MRSFPLWWDTVCVGSYNCIYQPHCKLSLPYLSYNLLRDCKISVQLVLYVLYTRMNFYISYAFEDTDFIVSFVTHLQTGYQHGCFRKLVLNFIKYNKKCLFLGLSPQGGSPQRQCVCEWYADSDDVGAVPTKYQQRRRKHIGELDVCLFFII